MMTISNGRRTGSWHVGETMNIPAGRVITIQLDGDELHWFITSLRYLAHHEDYNHPGIRDVNYPAERLTPVL